MKPVVLALASNERYFHRLTAKIGVSDLSRVRNGEDILLSFSGTTRPHIMR
jgi:hypothetical protein